MLQNAWGKGRDLDLAGLIQEVQNPSVQRIGVIDVEAFYPAKDRFELAMQLNNLLASPSFAAWMQGEPLDVGRLLHTDAASRGSRSSRSRTSAMRSGCSSSRCCSTRS